MRIIILGAHEAILAAKQILEEMGKAGDARVYGELVSDDPPHKTIVIGELTFCPEKRMVKFGGEIVPLTRSEYEALELLISHRGALLTKEEFLAKRYSDNKREVRPEEFNKLVSRIKKKLGCRGKNYIVNVWGVGHKLVAPS